ncbi:MAG TPA: glycosyltransferase family 4 protein [Tenuifilaceae bacterium]|nr:glycosyltransferase family 4 protein [Tenuifilaceae bacterium]
MGALLPHVKLYGGIKRFLELGNRFVEMGHSMYVFTPTGEKPDWFNFKGEFLTLNDLKAKQLNTLFFTEPDLLQIVLESNAQRKIFYFVRANESLTKLKRTGEITFYANSTNLVRLAKQKYGVDVFPAIGGVNLAMYSAKPILPIERGETFNILAYGRLAEGRKGTMYVVKACERLIKRGRNVHLILFDTPVTEKMEKAIAKFSTNIPYDFILNHPVDRNVEIFHRADVFVAPEKKAGWANTVAEAMACGIPVIATESGSKDFLISGKTGIVITRNSRKIANAIELVMDNESLRREYAENGRKKIEEFGWDVLANKIIQNLLSVQE